MRELEILLFGAGVAALGALALGAVVVELSRNTRVAKGGLAVGLGLGVLAFGAKLVLIAGFDAFGARYLALALPEERARPELVEHYPVATASDLPRRYVWRALPAAAPAPADNPTTPAKVALGERLFHDPRLSADDRVACASCHDLARKGGADGRPVSRGIGGAKGTRNAPTVINAAFQSRLFWDGRAGSLEEQALGPIAHPLEMGMASAEAAAEKLSAIAEYRTAFREAFGEEGVIAANIARAIAAHERTLITPDTPYDRFVRGERDALDDRQLRGMALFAHYGCVGCHSGPNFSGASLFEGNAPLRAFPALRGSDYESRYRLVEAGGNGVWRVPSLRNVTLTAPYFHNGAVADLREAIRVMARVQLNRVADNRPEARWRVSWSPERRTTRAEPEVVITDAEVEAIAAFLGALEGAV